MRAVIEKEALQDCLSGKFSDVFIAAYSSILGVTPEIIKEYGKISDNAGLFTTWFDRIFSVSNSYSLVLPEDLRNYNLDPNCIHSNYLGAAYYNSGPLIATSEKDFSKLTPANWGVPLVEANAYKHDPKSNQSNAKTAETITLTPKGTLHPSILSKYLMQELKVLIFDKSINMSGADFICEITRYCHTNCKFIVISNFKNAKSRGLLDRKEMEQHLNKHKLGGTIQVLQADTATIGNFHDRFIFLGSRFQLTFSSGVDCFGRTPNWTNSDGDITIHCIHDSKTHIELSTESGKRFRLKSKG